LAEPRFALPRWEDFTVAAVQVEAHLHLR